MTEQLQVPPPVLLARARVLEYAVLGESVRFKGHGLVFVGGKDLGPVPRLAICQAFGEAKFMLVYCDAEWEVLAAFDYDSVANAKARAERMYAGVTACWIDRQVTEAEATEYQERQIGHERCGFCGKLPFDVDAMVEHSRGGRICYHCIEELHAFINEEPEQS